MESRRFSSRPQNRNGIRLTKDDATLILLSGFLALIIAALAGAIVGDEPVMYMADSGSYVSSLLFVVCGLVKNTGLGAMALGLLGLVFFPNAG